MTVAAGAGVRRFGWTVAQTSACNVAAAVTAGVAGIIIARSLGPAVRGEYAAVMAWFGVALLLGQLGQSAATTYFVARERTRAADYLATSRNLMVISGVVTLGAGVFAAPLLASVTGAPAAGYLLMFATCVAGFVAASYLSSLQATHVRRWNVGRLSQPVAFLVTIAALYLLYRLDLGIVLGVVSATVVAQAGSAYWLCRREGLAGGRGSFELLRPLTRYGLGQVASAAPSLATTRLSVLVLSLTVTPTALGQYAVAESVTALAVPVVAAVGYVSFPRIASRSLSRSELLRLQRLSLRSSLIAGIVLMLSVMATASWLVPMVFGEGFRGAVPLVLLLAPGGVLLAWGRVCADLLKGHGRPYAVAGAEAVAAVVMAAGLAVLVPLWGVVGAAVAASVAAAVSPLLMLRVLRRVAACHDRGWPG